ncbi:hypothetical protein FHS81_002568 [Pseudochelatococcus contaminans]|uniref:Uncharacterized protein n=1 Tax=Pseudochelatococcus contaminans TaxID=1538103 RepID=A0A7W5Z699_9HYPH|nr:hypothetical protein [Pseudochelatococcus contaminans]
MRKFSPLAKPRVSSPLLESIAILSLLVGMVHVITPADAQTHINRSASLVTSGQVWSNAFSSKADAALREENA